MMVKRIVLTGGPCAGKTTILSKIERDLLEKGYKVFIVRESATELINGGITPHQSGVGMLNFQKLILYYQYQKEEIYNSAVLDTKDSDIVIIYDRGILDNKAYINELEFNDLLYDLSLQVGKRINEKTILDRYDMVIHLVTSAYGSEYSLENNKARYENKNEAILLDKKTLLSWIVHDNLQIVDNYENFNDKVNKVLSLVYGCIGEQNMVRYDRKFIVDIDNPEIVISKFNGIEFNIEQYYTDTMDKSYEFRIRKIDSKFGTNYYYVSQCIEKDGVKRILEERKINEKEFNRLMQFNIISSVIKRRITFVYDNRFYKLDLFSDGLKILEVSVGDKGNEIVVPNCFDVIFDVTNDLNYQNKNYGSCVDCKKKLKTK